MDDQDAYTVAQAAERLSVSPETVRKMIRKGDLTAVRLTERTLRIPRWSIEERLAPERRVALIEEGEFG